MVVLRSDFEAALGRVQPSAKREGFATTPDVSWADIGALEDVRDELYRSVLAPLKHPDAFRKLGKMPQQTGLLLFGPPGCGKTLIAKAIASESRCNFISVKGPELLNKYVGESERGVRTVFERGRASAPCVIFFDELDSLAPRRDGGDGNASAERVVNQLLTEMDGLDERKQVYVVAATNRADIIDPAMLRPGRLDKLVYVRLPDARGRTDILRAIVAKVGCSVVLLPAFAAWPRSILLHPCRCVVACCSDPASLQWDTPLDAGDALEGRPAVDLEAIGTRHSAGFSGADLNQLVRDASMAALMELVGAADGEAGEEREGEIRVTQQLLVDAALSIRPSVSAADHEVHERTARTFGHHRRAAPGAEGGRAKRRRTAASGAAPAPKPQPAPAPKSGLGSDLKH
jgi:SpoVK/Ycf46/Vps4 family AAA+-type ATPase